MFNPIVMTRLAELLQQGVIMKQTFQPYEAHLQYLLQFMTDYNLYGCDYLDASRPNFRSPVPVRKDDSSSSDLWHSLSVPPEKITDDPALPRVSHCSIEVDICVQDIVNRQMVKERKLHHDFIERTNPLPGEMKLVYSMAGLWKDEIKRRKQQLALSKNDSGPFPPEVLVTMSADPRQSQHMGWIHEEEYRDLICDLIKDEKLGLEGDGLAFETFVKAVPHENTVNTALQSVEDLYPKTLMPVLGLPSNVSQGQVDPASSIEVDEQKVRRVCEGDEDFFPADSDEEALRELGNLKQVKNSPHKPGASNCALLKSRQNGTSGFPSDRIIIGVCPSGMKTGKIPQIPIRQELLDAAEHHGVVGRTPKPKIGTASIAPTLKRQGSDLVTDVPAKRAKQDQATSSPPQSLQLVDIRKSPVKNRTPILTQTSALKSALSQGTKASSVSRDSGASSQTLNYRIVKDLNFVSSKLHLSQQSQKAFSQQHARTPFKKQVNFDPSTSFPPPPGWLSRFNILQHQYLGSLRHTLSSLRFEMQ